MKSSQAKVLHFLAEKPLLQHVIDCAKSISDSIAIISGHQAEKVNLLCSDYPCYQQEEQLGTGHAVQQAVDFIEDDSNIVILYGDVPLIQNKTLQALIESCQHGLSVLTVKLGNPDGYGRIVRKNGEIRQIVEQKDASADEKKINEVNSGIMCVSGGLLKSYLSRLSNDNAQGEYYLTDIIAMHVADGKQCDSYLCSDEFEVAGVNDKWQLARLERHYQQNKVKQICLNGTQVMDPARLDIRGDISLGQDVFIDVNVILEGNVTIGDNVKIGANVIIRNASIGSNSEIFPNSIIENSQIKENCAIGPFARIRPESIIENKAKVGNFVEVKKSTIGLGSKVSHLSYIGDTTMGKDVNIGAGTITCNYDGAFKHQTIIEDDVFIGSDSQLVAPVSIGKGSTVAAGSTITKNVEKDKLVLSRVAQKSISGWQRPKK